MELKACSSQSIPKGQTTPVGRSMAFKRLRDLPTTKCTCTKLLISTARHAMNEYPTLKQSQLTPTLCHTHTHSAVIQSRWCLLGTMPNPTPTNDNALRLWQYGNRCTDVISHSYNEPCSQSLLSTAVVNPKFEFSAWQFGTINWLWPLLTHLFPLYRRYTSEGWDSLPQ